MPTINIDFDVYLPSVTTYFNYIELLKDKKNQSIFIQKESFSNLLYIF